MSKLDGVWSLFQRYGRRERRRQRERWRSFSPGFMGGTLLAAALVTPLFGWFAQTRYDPHAARAAQLEEADQRSRADLLQLGWQPAPGPLESAALHLNQRLGVELLVAADRFTVPQHGGAIAAHPPSTPRALAAAAVLARELGRYDRAFLRASRLRRVLLCEGLHLGDVRIPSLPNYERTLLLDVDASDDFLARVVHHELFHFIDYADDDQLQHDPAWERTNPAAFVYGSGGRFLREPGASAWRDDLPGFLTLYATSGLEEDKAEVFACRMTAPALLHARAQADPVISKKVQLIDRQLARFLRRFRLSAPAG